MGDFKAPETAVDFNGLITSDYKHLQVHPQKSTRNRFFLDFKILSLNFKWQQLLKVYKENMESEGSDLMAKRFLFSALLCRQKCV